MGNSISSLHLIPTSLLECFNRSGEFDVQLYSLYRRHRRQVDEIDALLTEAFDAAMDEIQCLDNKEPRQRSVKKRRIEYQDPITGEARELVPEMSSWYVMYIQSPQLSKRRWRKKFRRVSLILSFAYYQSLLN